MDWKARLLYAQNWNIGFCEQTPEELVTNKSLSPIRWMKHPYRDRWFADPFIYEVTNNEIVVFVEECPMEKPKGIICELHIDRRTLRLLKRYVLLELDTHLSYPAIIRYGGQAYVYPENGASGKLNIYRYDSEKHQLVEPRCILEDAMADSTIINQNGAFYLIATKSENSQEDAFLYHSNDILSPFKPIFNNSVQSSRKCSRPAGNWITLNNRICRPSQNCEARYGSGITIMEVDSLDPYKESELFSIVPVGYKYSLGIHTLNFNQQKNLAVVDGYGYLNPTFSRIWNRWATIRNCIIRKR
ncbi:MAG: hypothetical protein IKH89_08170 [Bacteroidales bacterium]|nr:hypothetical protein [Bacteroidales bacterium]